MSHRHLSLVRQPKDTSSEDKAGKRVGIWVRVSTEDQAKGESAEHHEERARQYAAFKGWTVVTTYHLEAVSGKSVLGHAETKRMLDDVRVGQITGLIFSKIARLARNTRELIDIAEIFQECGADLVSLQESIDTSTPGGRNLFRIMGSMAEWEREEIADRVAASVPIRAALGKPLGGAAPFGYRWKDRKLVPDPAEVPVRKLLYELFAEHKRLKTVARLLTEAGHRTRNGSAFTHTTVERLIRDPIAKGRRRANYTKSLGEGKHWTKKPEEDWVWTDVEAVVSEDLWEECNRILDERRSTRKPPTKRPVHLFAGVVVCECGQKMYVPSNTPKYVCKTCRTKIPIVDLEQVFHEQLRDFFFSPQEVAAHLADADRTLADRHDLLAAYEREVAKVQGEMDKLYQLYLAGGMGTEGFGDRYRPLEDRLRQLKAEIPRLQGEIDFLEIRRLENDTLVTEAQDLYTRWPTLEASEKRAIVETVVEKITVGRDEVTIDLAYFRPSPEIAAKRARNSRGSSKRAGRSGPGSGGSPGLARR